MDKQLHKAGTLKSTTLVILGWLAFYGSYLFPEILSASILLQSVARVLP
ncbi:hypothetical protein [Enterovibrio norvegicus]|nr:hypothetical protein [Enterovibrio norvegicus]